jgi:hypothetical protein
LPYDIDLTAGKEGCVTTTIADIDAGDIEFVGHGPKQGSEDRKYDSYASFHFPVKVFSFQFNYFKQKGRQFIYLYDFPGKRMAPSIFV